MIEAMLKVQFWGPSEMKVEVCFPSCRCQESINNQLDSIKSFFLRSDQLIVGLGFLTDCWQLRAIRRAAMRFLCAVGFLSEIRR